MTLDQAGLDFYLSPATDFGYSSVYIRTQTNQF